MPASAQTRDLARALGEYEAGECLQPVEMLLRAVVLLLGAERDTWDGLPRADAPEAPEVLIESLCGLFRSAVVEAQKAKPAPSAQTLPPAAQTELLARARAAKAECGKLHRQLNSLRKDVHRELSRFGHELSTLAAHQETDGGGDGAGAGGHEDGGAGGSGGSGSGNHRFAPIGQIESCFVQKNGTPRQAGLAPGALSRLRVRCGTNPAHALHGLDAFSHVWLLWVFDRNGGQAVKAKGHPPVPVGLSVEADQRVADWVPLKFELASPRSPATRWH